MAKEKSDSSKWITGCRWLLVNGCRMLLAVTFVLSGIVKLIDATGTQYKVADYAQMMGLGQMMPSTVALLLAVCLALLEFYLGISMLFGVNRRVAPRLVVALLLLFTPVTFYLALTDATPDCGCFGDAWKLTNWQTFWKNVVLLAAALYVALHSRQVSRLIMVGNQWLVSLYSQVFAFVFVCINLYGLPLIDFRPYHIGADLLEKMAQPDLQGGDVETFFIMEKDGQRKEFTLENYPDSTWTFVDTRTEEKNPQATAVPEITDFNITTLDTGEDITMAVLADPGYKFFLVAPYLETADDGAMERIDAIYDYCDTHGYPFYCLTASGGEAITRWCEMTGAEYLFYHTDDVVLKTMVRANPGLMLLKGSTVVNKWPNTALPKAAQLQGDIENLPLSHPQLESKTRRAVGLLLWYVVPLLIITLADRLWLLWKMRASHKQNN